MSLVPLVAVFVAGLLPAPATSTAAETCAAESCAAPGVVLMQTRPGSLVPSKRGSPLELDPMQQAQMALAKLSEDPASLVQQAPGAISSGDVAAGQTSSPASAPLAQHVQAALGQMTVPASAPLASQAGASQTAPSAPLQAPLANSSATPVAPVGASQTLAAVAPSLAATALAGSVPAAASQAGALPATEAQPAVVQGTHAATQPAQASVSQGGTPEAKVASALAASTAGDDEKQEYDKAGYEKDFDTEWHEHNHSVYKKAATTEAPRSAAHHQGLFVSAAIAAISLALV